MVLSENKVEEECELEYETKLKNKNRIWITVLKIYATLVFCLIFFTQFNWISTSFLDVIWPKRSEYIYNKDGVTNIIPSIPFELSETNDRFISETSKVLGLRLSDLDFCQQRVILALKGSCHTLTDDEIAKIAIDLMNCKNIAESRQTIECTPSMSLKSCTGQMSPDMIAVYNQILSRTKSVCLSIRQDQFRGMAELTINRLMESSRKHLDMMETLKTSQKQLEKATLHSIDEINENQLNLMTKQAELLKLADTQRITMEFNLKEINKEKNFIKQGQTEIIGLIENLKSKLNEGLMEVSNQSDEAKITFHNLFEDLDKLNEISNKLFVRLDIISRTVHEKNREANTQFEETMLKLKDANEIVENFSYILQSIENNFNERVKFFELFVGEKEEIFYRAGLIIIHAAYLMVGMICLIFIKSDMISRYLFLLTISGNLTIVLNDLMPLNLLFLSKTVLLLLAINFIVKFYRNNDFNVLLECILKVAPKIKEQIQDELSLKKEVNNNVDTIDNIPILNNLGGHRLTCEHNPLYTRITTTNDEIDMRLRIPDPLNTSRSSTNLPSGPSVRDMGRCKALTRNGTQCQFMTPSHNIDYCRIHDRASRER